MTEAVGTPPLASLRVLDLTRLLPGPVATLHLADMGAQVIKIEGDAASGAGDYARSMGEGAADGNDSVFFRLVNRNKQNLRLDLKSQAGVKVFMRLAAAADVIVEGFRPGVVDKLGIGYAAVQAINPRIVYASITGYGQDGPWALRAGHDLNYIATAGLLDQIGAPDGGMPAIPNMQIGDLLGGTLTSLLGILAAVIGAKSSGRGRHVDVAMSDAVLAHMVFPMVATQVFGQPAARGSDLLSGGVPCYAVYRTADDRYLAVGALEPKFWRELCRVVERDDLAPYGLATGVEGRRVRDELARLVAAQPLAYWSELFATVDCCVTPVLRLDEAMAHPQFQARGMVREIGGVAQFALPIHFSDWSEAAAIPARPVGADSEAILREAGYDEATIAQLRRDRVI